MADAFLMGGGGGGTGSDECTARREHVLEGYSAVTADSDDEAVPGTMPNRGGYYWNQDLDIGLEYNNLYSFQPYGYYAPYDDRGMLHRIPIDRLRSVIGLHDAGKILDDTTIAGVRGTIPLRGAPEIWLGANQTYWREAGYYTGGYVSQNLPVYGDQWITPQSYAQTAWTSGHYAAGNIYVNPIPSNYYDINSQLVFSNGSYGPPGALGAYRTVGRFDFNVNPSHIPIPVVDGKLSVQNGAYIFRAALPATYRWIKIAFNSLGSNNDCYLTAVNPATMARISSSGRTFGSTSGLDIILDLSAVSLPSSYYLAFSSSSQSHTVSITASQTKLT